MMDVVAMREAVKQRSLQHVVVLGANGTMGYGSAALFTTAVPKVTFLARSAEKAQEGVQGAIDQVRSHTVAHRAETGSYDDNLEEALSTADLIFEAVAEDPAIKAPLLEKVDAARRDDAIVATVSSGLSINGLSAPLSESFQRHFAGLHFFNPPNVITGTELIGGDNTDPAVLDFLEAFSRMKLGREIIRTHDTPAFAGNRVGFKVLNEAAQLAETMSPAAVDAIVGPYTGRALTPLATIDLVGWDVHRAIVDNVVDKCDDEAIDTLKLPDYMAKLMDQGVMGNKSGGGFFKKSDDGKLQLNPATGEYAPIDAAALPDMSHTDEVVRLYSEGRYEQGMAALLAADGDAAKTARKFMAGYISYSFHRVGEVCDDINGIDRIMGAGFNWAPPSLLVDTMGPANAVKIIEEADLPVPAALTSAGSEPFFHHPTMNPGKFFVAAA